MKKLIFSFAFCMITLIGNTATIVLEGVLSDMTLSPENCYYLRGCVTVPNNVTLNILAGTQIRCENGSSLLIDRGGTINATGTAMSPIVFTSDQAATSRNTGDWVGLTLLGYATNNVIDGGGGVRDVVRCGLTYDFGGTNDADNSGILRYVRIEFAGQQVSGDTKQNALNLFCVGSGTEINNVQISESAQDAINIEGGTFDMRNIITLNAYRTDIFVSWGYRGKWQSIATIRKDVSAHFSAAPFSNGIIIENNPSNPTYLPQTLPYISQLGVSGPNYCDDELTVSSDFRNGIIFQNGGAGSIRNSFVAGWQDNGLLIADVSSVSNTDSNLLNFSYNAVRSVGAGNFFSTPVSWATGCGGSGSNMAAWISGTGLITCREAGNDFSLTDFGNNSSYCIDFCETEPDFSYTSTELEGTDYSAPFNDAFFAEYDYKGPFQATSFAADWTSFCPQEEIYCSLGELKSKAGIDRQIQFYPNPSLGQVNASFETKVSGKATLQVLDRVSGKVLRQVTADLAQGLQKISFSTQGLNEGTYPVKIDQRGSIYNGILVVK